MRTLLGAQCELGGISNWTKANMLSFNVNKTFAVLFSTKLLGNTEDLLSLDGDRVRFESVGKFLGLVLDSKLIFSEHIAMIRSKIYRSVNIFYLLRSIVAGNVLYNFYYYFVY